VTFSAWLAFTPRDTVFVRDGRSFDAAADASAQTVLPGPTTMAGAVGAAFGIGRAELRAALADGGDGTHVTEEVRGPVLAKRDGDSWLPYFPFPADLVKTRNTSEPYVYRLTPREQPGRTDLNGVRHWLMPPDGAEDVEPVQGWLPGHVLAGYLAGALPAADGTPLEDFEPLRHGEELADPFRHEPRVGLARDGRRARTGYLYQAAHLRFEENWAFLAEYTAATGWDRPAKPHVQLGGRGRLADVEPAAASWPVPGECRKRILVYLATPAVWTGGWSLPVPDGATLVAAATGEPQPYTSLGPRPELRWAVPAGSVYLLEFGTSEDGARWAAGQHGRALDRRVPEQPDLLRTAGFGVALTGVWDNADGSVE
jgi:CRISPR type III-B/RAMP module-associated protein Cmr3